VADKAKYQRPGDKPHPRLRIMGGDKSDPRRAENQPKPQKNQKKK